MAVITKRKPTAKELMKQKQKQNGKQKPTDGKKRTHIVTDAHLVPGAKTARVPSGWSFDHSVGASGVVRCTFTAPSGESWQLCEFASQWGKCGGTAEALQATLVRAGIPVRTNTLSRRVAAGASGKEPAASTGIVIRKLAPRDEKAIKALIASAPK